MQAVRWAGIVEAQPRVKRMSSFVVDRYGEVHFLRPGGGAFLNPADQARAKSLTAPLSTDQYVDDTPFHWPSIEIEAAYRLALMQHDPEVSPGELTNEVTVLQAELIVGKGLFLGSRPGCEQQLGHAGSGVKTGQHGKIVDRGRTEFDPISLQGRSIRRHAEAAGERGLAEQMHGHALAASHRGRFAAG